MSGEPCRSTSVSSVGEAYEAIQGTGPAVRRYAEADLPTRYGEFRVAVYREETSAHDAAPIEHCAIIAGTVAGGADVLTRVHSECLTGEVFHSLKCDCGEQLGLALRRIGEADRGLIIYLRQEGRGIGLGNKIRAYALQELGADTVDANMLLGFDPDARHYHVASRILADLGVRSIALMTNNPGKVDALREDGVVVTRRVSHIVESHTHNRSYLRTKALRMGHVLEVADPDAE